MSDNEKITAPAPDIAGLLGRAEAIRDAIAAKSISAAHVGSLFCDLVDAAGDTARALSLILAVHGAARPVRVDVIDAPPASMTCAPGVTSRIRALLFPRFASGSVLYTVTGDAAAVSPDGVVTPLRPGKCVINAVATADCSVFASVRVVFADPALRIDGSGALRLDTAGNIRLS